MRILSLCCFLVALAQGNLAFSLPKTSLTVPLKTSQHKTDLIALASVRGGGIPGKAPSEKAPAPWKPAYGINLHKLLVGPFTALLMKKYSCFTPTAWVYLALHGSYGILWVAKDVTFPDQQFQAPCSLLDMIISFIIPSVMYFPLPWLVVRQAADLPAWFHSISIATFSLGLFFMIGSDCQKYFTLKVARGKLITSGFFKHIRSPNYLGELLIYLSFSMLTFTPVGFLPWAAFLLLAIFFTVKKDRSLSRYPEFAAYKAKSSRILPPFF